jgi:hypothetical protein
MKLNPFAQTLIIIVLSLVSGVLIGIKAPASALIDPLTLVGLVTLLIAFYMCGNTQFKCMVISFSSSALPALTYQLAPNTSSLLITSTFAIVTALLLLDRILKKNPIT